MILAMPAATICVAESPSSAIPGREYPVGSPTVLSVDSGANGRLVVAHRTSGPPRASVADMMLARAALERREVWYIVAL